MAHISSFLFPDRNAVLYDIGSWHLSFF